MASNLGSLGCQLCALAPVPPKPGDSYKLPFWACLLREKLSLLEFWKAKHGTASSIAQSQVQSGPQLQCILTDVA